MLKRLQEWLRKSPYVHVRERRATGLSDVVGLVDRFIDGKMRYELEWDDFIA